jgi:hypothetical protein
MALSVEYTGKYTSERHQAAIESGKLTAGQVAKLINKQFKTDIKATELKQFATEWHHSGFYKGASGSTMGRTYFFTIEGPADIERLYNKAIAARQEAARLAEEPDETVYYFMTGFEKAGKRWQPIAQFGIAAIKKSQIESFFRDRKKIEMTKEEYELLKQYAGRCLESYETYTHFKNRMLNNGQNS